MKSDEPKTPGQEMIGALTELRDAIRSGEPLATRFTVRQVALDLKPRDYNPADVKRVRRAIDASQPLFAQLLGVDVMTVRSWEQGLREPSAMARRFLDEIAADPDRWKERLRGAIISKQVEP